MAASLIYTTNGISTEDLFLEILKAGNINPNPGPNNNYSKFQSINLPEKELRIGYWNVNRLNDLTKFE